MGMGNKVVSTINFVVRVISIVSLIYGGFQEPLVPYMQGIIGGAIDVYRDVRDQLFGGLGWVLSEFINWARQWLPRIPQAPWFSIHPIAKDIIIVYFLFGGSAKAANDHNLNQQLPWRMQKHQTPHARFWYGIAAFLFWPLFIYWFHKSSALRSEEAKKYEELLEDVRERGGQPYYEELERKIEWAKLARSVVNSFYSAIAWTVVGVIVVFVGAYAENLVGF